MLRGDAVMFCSNCGAEGTGNFCAKCGSPLRGQAIMPEALPRDWSSELRYETLVRIPEVRDLIAQAASAKQKHMSAEDFLEAADKLMSLAVPGLALKTVAEVVVPIFEHLGIKTGKTRSEMMQSPPGKAIVAVLCAFARQGQEIRQVQQFANGCLFEAAIPSDMWSWGVAFSSRFARAIAAPASMRRPISKANSLTGEKVSGVWKDCFRPSTALMNCTRVRSYPGTGSPRRRFRVGQMSDLGCLR
jgi:hypothetical protein